MREIKFRAKHGKEWVYGDLHLNSGKMPHIHPDPFTAKSIDPDTVGQFTGIEDKNGKEIYEGDILRVEVFKNESGQMERSDEFYEVFSLDDMKGKKEREYVTPVCWEDGAFVISTRQENDTFLCVLYGDMRKSFPIFIFEVIGNIYDNPELINKEYLV